MEPLVHLVCQDFQVQKEILAFRVLPEVPVTLDQKVTQDFQGCQEVLAVLGLLDLQV